ncbi:hypothetical protein [Streptomyces sp. NRRL B-24720]|nr:hypothetical protein [Streptomyces sp. NRRL B-24720]
MTWIVVATSVSEMESSSTRKPTAIVGFVGYLTVSQRNTHTRPTA